MDQTLTIINAPVIASGGIQENTLEVDFCSQWDGVGKTVIFYMNEDEVYNVVMTNDSCIIPHEVTANDGKLFFGIFGSTAEGKRLTTEIKCYKIVKGAFIEGKEPQEPTPDIYQQLIANYDAAMTKYGEILNAYNDIFNKLESMTRTMVALGIVNQNNPDESLKVWVGSAEAKTEITEEDGVLYLVDGEGFIVDEAVNVRSTIGGMNLASIFNDVSGTDDNIKLNSHKVRNAVSVDNLNRTTTIANSFDLDDVFAHDSGGNILSTVYHAKVCDNATSAFKVFTSEVPDLVINLVENNTVVTGIDYDYISTSDSHNVLLNFDIEFSYTSNYNSATEIKTFNRTILLDFNGKIATYDAMFSSNENPGSDFGIICTDITFEPYFYNDDYRIKIYIEEGNYTTYGFSSTALSSINVKIQNINYIQLG